MDILKYRNHTGFKISVHFAVWLLLFILPYLLSTNTTINLERHLKYTWLPLVYSSVLFYLNYFLFIDKFILTKKIWTFTIINLLLIAALVFLDLQLRNLHFFNIKNVVTPIKDLTKARPHTTKPWIIYKDTIYLFFPIIISIAIKITEKWTKTEAEKNAREKEILNSELQHLKYQLQPHFFFNSLNTIYALIEHSPVLAQETVHNLSKLMRYLLYDTVTEKVKLSDEIEFIKQFISLMKLRISDKTYVKTNFPDLPGQIKIAPLLFISLIENAFKHGISATSTSEILFSLNVENGKIIFVAENTNFPKDEKDKSGSGIGLKNLRKQLNLSYPGKHVFTTKVENNIFKVLLEIDAV
jgi:hypothetical protein